MHVKNTAAFIRSCSFFMLYQQPILDIKPYLPYCDSIHGAAVPEWVTCWVQFDVWCRIGQAVDSVLGNTSDLVTTKMKSKFLFLLRTYFII
ncbi:hypothetical protein Patl1_14364 [Pistacia atlantica]|uniref:Uncharacterized protein n=1 Tax=Pistacia atlantica TaxID=434234 RepID=A0ACC1AWB5_9ROSI|nr:hypothetical protein Patl1_14364 [Pistacia atlantica]